MIGMRRREFITLIGGAAAAWPMAAGAQRGERLRRIGVLVAFAEDDPETKARLAAFRRGLESADGLRASMSTSTLALQLVGPLSFRSSRRSWLPCNPM